jgi:hypothetical protein
MVFFHYSTMLLRAHMSLQGCGVFLQKILLKIILLQNHFNPNCFDSCSNAHVLGVREFLTSFLT